MKINFSALSDVGQKRKHNEDSYLANPRLGLFIIADGMGGHNAGEVASQMAVDIFSAEVHKHEKLLESYKHGPTGGLKRQILDMMEEAVNTACTNIFQTAEREQARKGMGTTLSALLLAGQSGFIAHAGDSRVYLIRDGKTHHLTEDHTLVQEQIKRGLLSQEEAVNFPYRNVVTRGVGLLSRIPVDTMHFEVVAGDRFLLCSDGLYDYFSDEEMAAMFEQPNLESLIRRLVELANERGGKDNLTGITVEVPELELTPGQIEVNRKVEALRKISLFERLNYPELVKALNIAQLVRYAEGDTIIREGEEGECMYILLSGRVEVLANDLVFKVLEKGGHFGEMSLIDKDVRSATVRAAENCDLLVIHRTDFFHLLNQEPHLAIKILLSFVNSLSGRLRETTAAFLDSRRRIGDIAISC